MTIKQYLYNRERLHERRERKFEKYMRLSARASSPGSALDLDGTPRSKGNNSREIVLTEAAAALEDYYKANEEYNNFDKEYIATLKQLPLSDFYLLYTIYVINQGRPYQERYIGVGKWTSLKRNEIPEAERIAEQHLTEILIKKGVDVE